MHNLGNERREEGSSRGLTVLVVVLQRHKLTNDVTFAQLQIKLLYSLYFIIVSNITYINLLILDSRTRSGEPGVSTEKHLFMIKRSYEILSLRPLSVHNF